MRIAAVRMRRNNGKLLEGNHSVVVSCHASLIDIWGVILDNSSCKCDSYLGTYHAQKLQRRFALWFVAEKFKFAGRKSIKNRVDRKNKHISIARWTFHVSCVSDQYLGSYHA